MNYSTLSVQIVEQDVRVCELFDTKEVIVSESSEKEV